MFLSGMNIVKEKEIGTIEQINVTPIRKYQFIIGAIAAFLDHRLVELSTRPRRLAGVRYTLVGSPYDLIASLPSTRWSS